MRHFYIIKSEYLVCHSGCFCRFLRVNYAMLNYESTKTLKLSSALE